jgi:hypothetical protein
MMRIRSRTAVVAVCCVVIAGAVLAAVSAVSRSPTYVRPPLLCAANGLAVNGPDVWLSGCVFKEQSAFSTRIPAIVEFDATNGSLLKVFKDRNSGNDGPAGIAVIGSRVWVANGDGNSVVELDANTGLLVRIIKSQVDRFNSPWTIAASGSRVWVFNTGNNTITELNASNGSLVRIISAKADQLTGVDSVSVSGSHLWLTDGTYATNSIVELNSSKGSLVRDINARADDFNSPSALAISGSRVWVTIQEGAVATTPQADGNRNLPGGSVTELIVRSGSLVRVINAKADDFYGSAGVAIGHSRVWVTNSLGGTVTELNASTGSLVRVIGAKADRLGDPTSIRVSGSHVWVLDSAVSLSPGVWGGAITELNASNGSLVRIIK